LWWKGGWVMGLEEYRGFLWKPDFPYGIALKDKEND
jgi:hypothetical protein